MVEFISTPDLRYIQKHVKRIWFKEVYLVLKVKPRRGSVIIGILEYVSKEGKMAALEAPKHYKKIPPQIVCGFFIYLDLRLQENLISLLAPSAKEQRGMFHFFEFWSMVDRSIVLIVNTIMVFGIFAHQGVLMWPFLFWAPLQVATNVLGTLLLAYYVNKSCLYLFLLVCIDTYGWGVVFSSRKHMYVEDIVQARYNELLLRDAYTRLEYRQRKRYKKLVENVFGKGSGVLVKDLGRMGKQNGKVGRQLKQTT